MQRIKAMVVALAVTLTLAFAAAGPVAAAPAATQSQAQTVCPVLGGAIDKNVYTDYQGKRIYFCCAACIEEFNQNPEKYLQKLKEAGVTPEAAPAGPGTAKPKK
jgi:YHS domain-containing protein